MAYDYRPTASRAATTDPNMRAQRRRVPPEPEPEPEPRPDFQTPAWTPTPPAPAAPIVATITVAAVIEEFIDASGAGRSVKSALRDHVAPELGAMRIDDVRRRDVEGLMDDLEADGIALSRTRAILSAVRTLYAHAMEQGYVSRNPADGVLLPDDSREDYQPLALLPERILSLVLRIVVLLFVLFALVTIAGSA